MGCVVECISVPMVTAESRAFTESKRLVASGKLSQLMWPSVGARVSKTSFLLSFRVTQSFHPPVKNAEVPVIWVGRPANSSWTGAVPGPWWPRRDSVEKAECLKKGQPDLVVCRPSLGIWEAWLQSPTPDA